MNFHFLPFKPRVLAAVLIGLTLARGVWRGYLPLNLAAWRSLAWRRYGVMALAAAAAVAGFLFLDRPFLNWIQSGPAFLSPFIRLGGPLDKNLLIWMALTLGFFAAELARKHPRLWFNAFLATLITAAAGNLLKFVFFRARPYSGLGPFSFFHGVRQHAYESLPSGDVALVSGAALYFFLGVRNAALRLALLILPFSIALRRVSDDKHWPTDTLASVAIALVVAKIMTDYAARHCERT